ncbi:uncharacterized protein GBIM_21681, partial [Gryllus bimaculatus]
DVSIEETVKAAEFFLSDGVILTGTSTGNPASITELHKAKLHAKGPVIIGSGITSENLHDYIAADALIVGSYFKRNGNWEEELDFNKVKLFMETVKKERGK